MAKVKVAFLGPTASFTHQATIASFPPAEYEHIPVITIRDIFAAVQSGTATHGVVPFENSTNGSVVFTLDLFADREASFPDISVCDEAYLAVEHCLLGRAPPSHLPPPSTSRTSTPTPSQPSPRSAPIHSLAHIQRIYSHPQAFGQCEIFLTAHLKGIERIDVSSTSAAAALVAADTTGTSAAIASFIATNVHDIGVLARGIEDREDNRTRFFVLRKGAGDVEGTGHTTARHTTVGKEQAKQHKSLVSFTVPHRAPGALADVLDCFRRYKLNLTSINSRPSRVVPFEYIFFVEFLGSVVHDPDGSVKDALESLGKVARTWRLLGSWEDRWV